MIAHVPTVETVSDTDISLLSVNHLEINTTDKTLAAMQERYNKLVDLLHQHLVGQLFAGKNKITRQDHERRQRQILNDMLALNHEIRQRKNNYGRLPVGSNNGRQ